LSFTLEKRKKSVWITEKLFNPSKEALHLFKTLIYPKIHSTFHKLLSQLGLEKVKCEGRIVIAYSKDELLEMQKNIHRQIHTTASTVLWSELSERCLWKTQ